MLKTAYRITKQVFGFFALISAAYFAMGISPAFQTFTGVSMSGVTAGAQGIYTAGVGILINSGVISIDSATVPTMIETSASLSFASSIGSQVCSDFTITFTGAQVGDKVSPAWPATLEAGIAPSMFVSAANTLKIRLCNNSAAAITPVNQTFGAGILRLN